MMRLSAHSSTVRQPPDRLLIWTVGLLVGFGLLALGSASVIYSHTKFGNSWYVLLHQMITGLIPGLLLAWMASRIDYQRWERYFWPLLLFSVGLLLLVFVPGLGLEINRARSWVHLGPYSFQPAEIVKLSFCIVLVSWCARRGYERLRTFTGGFVPFLLLLGLISGPIVLQPDLGTLLVIVAVATIIFFTAGAKLTHLALLAAGAAAATWAMVLAAPYRVNRLLIFLHPEQDLQGIGYHLNQALLAVGSGGWLGRGLGRSLAKFSYLPEVAADSIFAVIAEELGFITVFLLVAAYATLLVVGVRIARQAPDPYGRLLAVGLTSWLVLQAFLNMMGMIGLAPLTGLPMPLVSAGGTALAANLAAVGVLANISRHAVRPAVRR